MPRPSLAPSRRKEDPQRVDLYAQTLEIWHDYVTRLSENVARIPLDEARRLAAKNKLTTLLPAKEVACEVYASESEEMRWLTENSRHLEIYRGEWLLIQGRELVAHNADFPEIRVAIAERNIRSPFIYYVPTVEEANFISI